MLSELQLRQMVAYTGPPPTAPAVHSHDDPNAVMGDEGAHLKHSISEMMLSMEDFPLLMQGQEEVWVESTRDQNSEGSDDISL